VKQVEFDPKARVELDRAADEYEVDYPGRGLRFYSAVERAVETAAATPTVGHRFPGVPDELGVLRLLVKHFRYALAYRVVGEVLRIDAVAHTRRRPGYWLDRLDEE